MSKQPLSKEEQMARITDVQVRYTDTLMMKKNVVGVAVGLSTDDDEDTAHFAYCLVVMVSEKVAESSLNPEDRIPEMIEDVPVEVREVGSFLAG